MQPWLRDQGSGGSRYEDITLEANIKMQLESDKEKSRGDRYTMGTDVSIEPVKFSSSIN